MLSYLTLLSNVVKYLMALSLLSLIIAGASIAFLNYTGFCWTFSRHWPIKMNNNRWLSDEEQVRRAINALVTRGPTIQYHEGWGSIEYGEPILYKSVEDFLAQNPNCCKLIGRAQQKSIPEVNFLTSIFGYSADVIELRYSAHFRKQNGSLYTIENFTEYAVISNCGYVNSDFPDY